ncbi:MAG: transglutaminase family protein [Burkholderiales bacterium]|nr:transglutaminase family protein [Burkholderiales bacterium]
MKITVEHSTVYYYSEPIKHSSQIIRLIPFDNLHQNVIRWGVFINNKKFAGYVDWFGNNYVSLDVFSPINKIEIKASGVVETNNSIFNQDVGSIPLDYYLNNSSYVNWNSELLEFANVNYIDPNSINLTDKLNSLSAKILEAVPYITGITNSSSSATEAFSLKAGVCQDHSHIILAIVRYFGFPARYVSGYLHTPDTSHVASHAWVEIFYENAWHSFDVSNQCHAGVHHIILAYGLDYNDASPVRGSRVGGGIESLETHALVSNQ